jgi:hypothetical protein
MRALTIVLVLLLALLPDCLACSLCAWGGGPCAPAADACCDEEGGAPAPDDASPAAPCSCGEGCIERDPAPGADGAAAAAVPPPAIADLPLPGPALDAPPAPPFRTPRAAGPPGRLRLRI